MTPLGPCNLLTLREVARWLRVRPETMRGYLDHVPSRKVGRARLWLVSDVLKAIPADGEGEEEPVVRVHRRVEVA